MFPRKSAAGGVSRMVFLIALLMSAESLSARKFVITVDDVPCKYFGRMVDFMETGGHFTIWFFTEYSEKFDDNADLIRRVMTNENFVVGNHTKSHDYELMKKGWYYRIEEDIRYVHEYFSKHGYTITLFRAPYGYLSNQGLRAVIDMKYGIVTWSMEIPSENSLKNTDTKIDRKDLVKHFKWHYPSKRDVCVLLMHPNRYIATNLGVIFEAIDECGGVATRQDYEKHIKELIK